LLTALVSIILADKSCIMPKTLKYILFGLGFLLIIGSIWYFINIVAYILLSAVFALIGRPIVDVLGKIKYKRFEIPKCIRAFVALVSLWAIFITIVSSLLPLLSGELASLRTIDVNSALSSLHGPISQIEAFIEKYNIAGEPRFTVENYINSKLTEIINATFITNFLSSLAGVIEHVFIGVFAVSFITFFFLKDEKLFSESLLLLIPDKHIESFKNAMTSTRRLLVRYFIGILFQMTGIFTIICVGLNIVGLGFGLSVLIALLAAILNIIPYIGPFIGAIIGVLLTIATHLDMDFYNQVVPIIGWVLLVFLITKLTDDIIFQPFIFSSSVKAHPLEIFLVILIAGSLAGVQGMILAIPGYTVLRVFAKEFLNKFKVVKKLTSKI
jgi:predicted PurR-regulated permease PerM